MQLTSNSMKKIIVILLCLFTLVGCQGASNSDLKLYNEMIEILSNADDFASSSKYFSTTFEVTSTSEGQRYYIVIDNPNIAMYDVSVIAFEEDADTENAFAPNAGIFDEEINIVPNQINKDKGYVKGISISGLLTNNNPVVYCLVQWKDDKNTKVFREYLKLTSFKY